MLLPGVYETWQLLGPIATALARAGHPVHAVPGLGYNRRPFAEAADRTAAFLEQSDLHDVVLVAHSKGGLVGKRVMLSTAGPRVTGMVAVATPFHGSRYAQYLLGRTLRAFSRATRAARARRRARRRRPHHGRLPALRPAHPETGRLEGGRNVELPLAGHFLPLGDPALVEIVVREVDRFARSAPAD